jgi:hypothetical protein
MRAERRGHKTWIVGAEIRPKLSLKHSREYAIVRGLRLQECYHHETQIKECFRMPEVEVKNLEITPKPKCLRCGSEHTVSDLGHWMPGWFTCQICNVRWEEDEYE